MQRDPDRLERWNSGGSYEPFIGRWSRLVAGRFVEWLDPTPGTRWLDVGCGTGALTQAILHQTEPASVRGVDPSAEYVSFAGDRIRDPRAVFEEARAQELPAAGGPYDYTVSGLVLNFLPDATAALAEMARVTRPGGTIAAYVWDYAEGMEMLRYFWDAAAVVNPRAVALDEGSRFPICRPEPLRSLWQEAGLGEAALVPIEIETRFAGFDDYWTPFLGGEGPAPTYIASLTEPDREALRSVLQARLPATADGSIPLRAKAWAIRGRA